MRAMLFAALCAIGCGGGSGSGVSAVGIETPRTEGPGGAGAPVMGMAGATVSGGGAVSVSAAGSLGVAGTAPSEAGAATVSAAGSSAGGSAGDPGLGGGGSAGALVGGSAGATDVDPLTPFAPADCPSYTEYRIPFGKALVVTGDFLAVSVKSGACLSNVIGASPIYCGSFANSGQCECMGPNPGDCNPYCDGSYLITAIKAAADCGASPCFTATLEDGSWNCIHGIPTKTAN